MPGELARARAAVAAWRGQNPAGNGEEMIAAIGHHVHQDYGAVLRAMLFAVGPAPGASGHRHPCRGAAAVTWG
jgi:hypothetical protein